MAIFGETINQKAPIVTITGSISGSFTFDPTTAYSTERKLTNGSSGNWRRVDHGRTFAHELASSKQLPVIVGIATVTITPSAGTQVHYRIGPKNPTSKGITKDGTVNSDSDTDARSQSYVYNGAFPIDAPRPGNTVVTLRLRAYKIANEEISGTIRAGVSPNEKSEIVILKFVKNDD
jgi:hypothetical protein